jgi:hypothetical protein
MSLLLLEWHTRNVIGLLILLIVALLSFAGTGSGTSGSTPAPQSHHRYSQPRSTDPCRGTITGDSSRSKRPMPKGCLPPLTGRIP